MTCAFTHATLEAGETVPARQGSLCVVLVVKVHKGGSGEGRMGIRWGKARPGRPHKLQPEPMRTDCNLWGPLLCKAPLRLVGEGGIPATALWGRSITQSLTQDG